MARERETQIVRAGYDVAAAGYTAGRDRFDNRDVVEPFCALLPPGARVLDVGCGPGVPVARHLAAAGFEVTGVDISVSMLAIASARVPAARFARMDMRALAFPDATFHGITACYSLFHVPKELHRDVIFDFARLLAPAGALLFSSGLGDFEEVAEFHGAPMFWSHLHPKATRQAVFDAGLEPQFAEVREHGGEHHYWVLARKPPTPQD